jgi:hypothetical protein
MRIERISAIKITEERHAIAARLADEEVSPSSRNPGWIACALGRKGLSAQKGNGLEIRWCLPQRSLQVRADTQTQKV